MNNNLRKGLRFEDQAARFLASRGLEPLTSNYRCRFGEIDLVMLDAETVCFIEVRYRKSQDFGGAGASVTASKQRRIARAASLFVAGNRRLEQRALRFDVLLIQHQADGSLDFNWIQNAFYAE